jgi:hypothetical protein
LKNNARRSSRFPLRTPITELAGLLQRTQNDSQQTIRWESLDAIET